MKDFRECERRLDSVRVTHDSKRRAIKHGQSHGCHSDSLAAVRKGNAILWTATMSGARSAMQLVICCVVCAVRTLLEMQSCGLLYGARCAIDLSRRVLKAIVA